MNGLRECPHCGGEAWIDEDCGKYVVFCKNPDCSWRDSEDEAIESWNTRFHDTCEMVEVPRFCPPGEMVTQDMVYECSKCHGIVEGRESGPGSPEDPYQWTDVPSCMVCCPTCGRRIS